MTVAKSTVKSNIPPPSEEAVIKLLELEYFDPTVPIMEPCSDTLKITKLLRDKGYMVSASTNLVFMPEPEVRRVDFFTIPYFHGNIITRPPVSLITKYLTHALAIIPKGRKVAMFLPASYFGTHNHECTVTSATRIYITPDRATLSQKGDWYIWKKGVVGKTQLQWLE